MFLRVDLNVPLSDGSIADDSRIVAAIPTIDELRERGAALVVATHLGRPKGIPKDDLRTRVVADALTGLLGGRAAVQAIGMPDEHETIDAVGRLAPGDIAMLENLRFDPGEEANDPRFAGRLAELADAYVDDAFGAAHRAHASIAALPELMLASGRPAVAGRLLQKEVEVLGRLLHGPERPYVAVLGGAKVSDKLGVIDALLHRVDHILIGGAMAFTLLAAEGSSVGRSLVEHDRVKDVRGIRRTAEAEGVRMELPTDVVAAAEPALDVPRITVPARAIPDDLMGLDVGPSTVEAFGRIIADARTVLWNGPMGVFEVEPFSAGTRGIALAIARANAYSVVGGGDSIAAVRQAGLEGSFDHLSTGGGASLEFLEGRPLPGITILED
ncbi:MAG: phosphoglycerate kinase [Actinobacteria bacterium]|nr:MAG: phosphoglycerate kinase [Actinomycetota bacterium]TMK93925.1 MAG: phosphoglycerate kinase [Actinomycetota bacterium]TMM26030.1 MAG: phosphoglycerate kinase [Actinomycetota bacterium]